MVVDDIVDFSEVHTGSIFIVKVCRMMRFYVYITFCCSEKNGGRGIDCLLVPPLGLNWTRHEALSVQHQSVDSYKGNPAYVL